MKSQWILEISLVEKYGTRQYSRAIELPVSTFGEQLVPDMNDGFAFLHFNEPFDAVVTMLKEKQFRRNMFIHEAKRLGGQLADYLEDKEGWHGSRRQDGIKALDKQK